MASFGYKVHHYSVWQFAISQEPFGYFSNRLKPTRSNNNLAIDAYRTVLPVFHCKSYIVTIY